VLGWLTKLETVRVATTAAEREAIYRFRYSVYIEELKLNLEADHERKWLKQPEDDKPYTTLLYAGTPDDIKGAVRVRAWKPGAVPREEYDAMSLQLFPGIEKLGVAHVGRLMIRPSLRGKLVLPSLMVRGYDFMAGECQADLAFLACVPGIVRHYRQLGARPYGGRLVDLGYGQGIPLVIVLSDHAHLKRSGSIVAPQVKKHFGPGKRPALDTAPYRHVLEGEALPVEFDAEKVWLGLQESLLAGAEPAPTFVDALPPEVVKRLAATGYLLKVGAGDLITREGIDEREMYVILEGLCSVEAAGRQVALLERGELFGEVAFFRESGERTASVRAVTPCRLLVLRRKSLEELARTDPDASHQILLNVARIMAERLATLLRERDRQAEGDGHVEA